MIDILNLEPTKVSRDLKSKYMLIYGKPKIGKTTFACSIPDALILATEKGYNAMDGVLVQDIKTWADALIVLRQLRSAKAKEKFKSVVIDTFTILSELCEKYICSNEGVATLGDIPWGGGYAMLGKELGDFIRGITMEGYGLVLIAHSKEAVEQVDENKTVTYYSPNLSKRAMGIANQAVDIIAFANEKWDKEGNSQRYLVCRQTPNITAGSRFPEFPNVVPLEYNAVVDALVNSIEAQGRKQNIELTDEAPDLGEDLNYDELMGKAKELYGKFVNPNKSVAENDKNKNKILDKVEKTLGKRKKLSEITPNEVEALAVIIDYMENME